MIYDPSFWVIIVILFAVPALRKWACFLLGILLVVYLYTVSIWLFCGVLAVLIGTALYGIYQAHRGQQEWEANQPPRATGYNPNNGWEYVENSPDDEI